MPIMIDTKTGHVKWRIPLASAQHDAESLISEAARLIDVTRPDLTARDMPHAVAEVVQGLLAAGRLDETLEHMENPCIVVAKLARVVARRLCPLKGVEGVEAARIEEAAGIHASHELAMATGSAPEFDLDRDHDGDMTLRDVGRAYASLGSVLGIRPDWGIVGFAKFWAVEYPKDNAGRLDRMVEADETAREALPDRGDPVGRLRHAVAWTAWRIADAWCEEQGIDGDGKDIRSEAFDAALAEASVRFKGRKRCRELLGG